MTTLILPRFDSSTPVSTDTLNQSFSAIVNAINMLSGSDILQWGQMAGSSPYAELTGAAFLGGISAPSCLVGEAGGIYPVVTTNDLATLGLPGIVMKAAAVVVLAQSISSPPTQAEVTAIQTALNNLILALKAAGSLA